MSAVSKEDYPITYKVLKRLECRKQDVITWRAIWRHYGGIYLRLDEEYPWFYAFFDDRCWRICEAHNGHYGCGKCGSMCKESSGLDHKCIVCRQRHSHGMFNKKKSTHHCKVLTKFLAELSKQCGAQSLSDVTVCLMKINPDVFK